MGCAWPQRGGHHGLRLDARVLLALAKEFVRDPRSPLFAPGDDHTLRTAAHIAHPALKRGL